MSDWNSEEYDVFSGIKLIKIVQKLPINSGFNSVSIRRKKGTVIFERIRVTTTL